MDQKPRRSLTVSEALGVYFRPSVGNVIIGRDLACDDIAAARLEPDYDDRAWNELCTAEAFMRRDLFEERKVATGYWPGDRQPTPIPGDLWDDLRRGHKELCCQRGLKEPSVQEMENYEKRARASLVAQGITPHPCPAGRNQGTSRIVGVMKSVPEATMRRGLPDATGADVVKWLKDKAPESEQKKALFFGNLKPKAIMKSLREHALDLLSIGIEVKHESGGRISIGYAETTALAGPPAGRCHSGDR
jgi:hypothetical protein